MRPTVPVRFMKKTIYSKQQELLLQLLVEARQGAGITQGELAALLGITQSEVSKHERGERGLDFLQVRMWVEVLGIPFEGFVGSFEEKLVRTEPLTGFKSPTSRQKARVRSEVGS